MEASASKFDTMKLRAMANYQFGVNVGHKLFPDGIKVKKSKRGKIRYVYFKDSLIAIIRAKDGFILPTMEGAKLIYRFLKGKKTVLVSRDVEEFVKRGKNLFAKHVVKSDVDIRPGEEVFVVNEDGELIAVGKAILSGEEMMDSDRGVAVKVRHSLKE
ncbi:MAG: PUA domain-containing protein [Candidatus Asgardarchaeia archaeon]